MIYHHQIEKKTPLNARKSHLKNTFTCRLFKVFLVFEIFFYFTHFGYSWDMLTFLCTCLTSYFDLFLCVPFVHYVVIILNQDCPMCLFLILLADLKHEKKHTKINNIYIGFFWVIFFVCFLAALYLSKTNISSCLAVFLLFNSESKNQENI